MAARDRKDSVSLLEAVETLSTIADLDFNENGIDSEFHQHPALRQIHWLETGSLAARVDGLRSLFKTILNHFRQTYTDDTRIITDAKTIDGIKTIMVVVGEAAKKLDRYTALFKKSRFKSVTELKEYKRLQEFYHRKISRKIDEALLGKWILALAKTSMSRKNREGLDQTSHVFVDLESVKSDTDYELFLMKKDDGGRFFSPRLIRNIKLISDFGDQLEKVQRDDPLASLKIWHDRISHGCAKNIIKSTNQIIARFYQEIKNFQEKELTEKLNKAFIALMLSANPNNLMHNLPLKTCHDYLLDFLEFLREAMRTRNYQDLVSYPIEEENPLAQVLLNTTHAVCQAIYCRMNGYQEVLSMIHSLLIEANQSYPSAHNTATINKVMWSKLSRDYAAMIKLMKSHPNGSLNKTIETIEEGTYHVFDPLTQDNFPGPVYSIYGKDGKCHVFRMACPTLQEFIHKSEIDELFKGFLRGCHHPDGVANNVLYIDLQDGGSWREKSRCKSLHDLALKDSFKRCLTLVCLPKDTEFYYQKVPYHHTDDANEFMAQLKGKILDEVESFVLPSNVQRTIAEKGFTEGICGAIHRIFFGGKKTLSREQRQNFIEIFYLFLELKLIEIAKPDTLIFGCKDGIDCGGAAAAQLFIFMKILNQEMLSENDQEHLELMLYGPSIMIRERLMMPDRFGRMISVIRIIESLRQDYGFSSFGKIINEAFGRFFNQPVLQTKVIAGLSP